MFDDKENNYNENINNSNNSQSVPGNIQAENHFYDDYKKPERTEENKQEQNMNSQPQQENRYIKIITVHKVLRLIEMIIQKTITVQKLQKLRTKMIMNLAKKKKIQMKTDIRKEHLMSL